jgi:hypothetical protein
MCISKDLEAVDCTEGPHPHSNNYCRNVKIPPLRRGRVEEVGDRGRLGGKGGGSEEGEQGGGGTWCN